MFSLILISGIFAAIAAGFVGVFVIFKRMALVGDALSHVALPGIALALILSIDTIWGALVFLLVGSLVMFLIFRSTKLYEEAIVGILFSLSLALGVILIKGPDLDAALFGDILKLSFLDVLLTIALSLVIIALTSLLYRRLALSSFSADLARANGVNIETTNFLFFILLALAVALGVKVVGTLLVGSLVIIPQAAATNIAKSLKSLIGCSISFAVISIISGLLVGAYFNVSPGPLTVVFEGLIFLASWGARSLLSE